MNCKRFCCGRGSESRPPFPRRARYCQKPPTTDDDYLIALAIASDADLIVSGDGHLLGLDDESLPKILRPADFLERFQAES